MSEQIGFAKTKDGIRIQLWSDGDLTSASGETQHRGSLPLTVAKAVFAAIPSITYSEIPAVIRRAKAQFKRSKA